MPAYAGYYGYPFSHEREISTTENLACSGEKEEKMWGELIASAHVLEWISQIASTRAHEGREVGASAPTSLPGTFVGSDITS